MITVRDVVRCHFADLFGHPPNAKIGRFIDPTDVVTEIFLQRLGFVFNIEITPREAYRFETFGDIADLIEAKTECQS